MFMFQLLLTLFSFLQVENQDLFCASEPCKNGAICEETLTGYRCFCKNGFAGENCNIDFNDCVSQPCKNNATCIDGVANYTCLCARGFTGNNCQTDIDDCASSPCSTNSTCIDMINDYVCQCSPPYRGDNCSVLPCDTIPCSNAALCRNDLNFNESLIGFVCECLSGFTGPRCDINIEDCDLENFTSCSGNGACVDGINDFSCLCEPGWVGDRCQSTIDDCIGNSCKNNATCVDRHLGYTCQCTDGYGGAMCEREIDECSEWSPCENGASCVDLFDDYRCECASGWYGENCSEEVNECETNPCYNGADCLDIIDGFVCRCPPFYTGLLCETQYNPCAPEYNQCQNGANCVAPPDGQYRCYCPVGLTGTKCEVDINNCESMPCMNNGTCEDIINGFICHCDLGWSGKTCGIDVDECADEPCFNDAECQDLLNGFECNCTREYQGRLCEEAVDFCQQQPCFHNGECVSKIGGFECICYPPYNGERCLDLIDACYSDPCENNATCMNIDQGFICNCPPPYTGATCNDTIDFCASKPCFNDGTCFSLVDDFYCACQEYLTGRQCTDFSDFCEDAPCKNDANCISGEFKYRCVCAYGFIGETCDQMIDFCKVDPCLNGANCSNVPGGFVCLCPIDYTGVLCQNIIIPLQFTSTLTTSLNPSVISTFSIDSLSTAILDSMSYQSSMYRTQTVMIVPSTSHHSLNTPTSLLYSLLTDLKTHLKSTSVLDTSYISFSSISDYQETVSEYSMPLSSEFMETTASTDSLFDNMSSPTMIFSSSLSSSIYIGYSSNSLEESFIYSSVTLSQSTSTMIGTSSLHKSPTLSTSKSDPFFSLVTTTVTLSTSVTSFSGITFTRSTILPTSLFVQLSTKGQTTLHSTSFLDFPSVSTDENISPTSTIELKTSVINLSNDVNSYSILPSSTQTTLILSSINTGLSSSIVYSSVTTQFVSLDINFSIPSSAPQSSSYSARDPEISSIFSSYLNNSILFTSNTDFTLKMSSVFHLSSSFHNVNTSNSYFENKSSTKTPIVSSFLFTASAKFSQTSLYHSFYTAISTETSSLTDVTTPMKFHTVSSDTSESSNAIRFESSMQTTSYLSSTLLPSIMFSNTPSTSSSTFQHLSVISSDRTSMTTAKPYFTTINSSSSKYVSTSIPDFTFSSYVQTIASLETSESNSSVNSDKTLSLGTTTIVESRRVDTFFPLSSVTASSSYNLSTYMSNIPTLSSEPNDTNDWLTSLKSNIHTTSYLSLFSSSLNVDNSSSALTKSSLFSNEFTSFINLSSSIMTFQMSLQTTYSDLISTLVNYSTESSRNASTSSTSYTIVPNTSMNSITVMPSEQSSEYSSNYLTAASTDKFISSSTENSDIHSTVSHAVTPPDSTATPFTIESSMFSSTELSSHFYTDYSIVSSLESTTVSLTGHSILPSFSISYEYSPVSKDGSIFNTSSIPLTATSLIHHTSVNGGISLSSPIQESTFMSAVSNTQDRPSSHHLIHSSPTVTSLLKMSSTASSTNALTVTSTSTASSSISTESPYLSCRTFLCQNGGVCREDYLGIYCDCSMNFIGNQCEIESNICNGHKCENGGRCTVVMTRYGNPVPTCHCPLPFTGTRCENEKLIYYPSFTGNSYMEFTPPTITFGQSNEVYISVKTTQEAGAILYAANQIPDDNNEMAFMHLYLTNGELRYKYSCDGLSVDIIDTKMAVNTGDVYDVIIRQVWSQTIGDWCSAVVIINEKVFVGKRQLSLRQPGRLRKIYIGGIPRFTNQHNGDDFIYIMNGFVGCVHSFLINQQEVDLVSMTTRANNIDNCNVPVCAHNPCRNNAACHSFGEEWYCSCQPGYGGALCERKLCDVNPCYHGGTCIVLEIEQDQLCLCVSGRGGALCEDETDLTVPNFFGRQYNYSSFVAYDAPHYIEDNFEIEFEMVVTNESLDSSVLLYIGNIGSYDGRRDFMSVGIYLGYLVFRYDLGSGFGQIFSSNPLDSALPQHRVRLGRMKQYGWLQLDNQRNMIGRSPGLLTALNTNSKFYVGDVELPEIGVLPDDTFFSNGFSGCIFNLKIRNHDTEFLPPGYPPGHVSEGRNVGHCSSVSCDLAPCKNGGKCVGIGASVYCNCTGPWKGTFCTDKLSICDTTNLCINGSTCLPLGNNTYMCVCPLGKHGEYCGQDIVISDAKFFGEHSFMSFTPVFVKRHMRLRLQIKLEKIDGLIFYTAQRLHSTAGDFMSLTLNKGYVTCLFNMGTGTNVIRSDVFLNNDTWYTVEVGRNTTHGYIAVDNQTVVELLNGTMSVMDITTHFYLGSLPNLADVSPDAFVGEPAAYTGCIRDFVVNGFEYDLTQQGAVQGANIGDCDGTSCGYKVCGHGDCILSQNKSFICKCSEDYVGDRCEISAQCMNHSCVHGQCVPDPSGSYKCICKIGWTSYLCDKVEDLGSSVRFNEDSYMSISDEGNETRNKTRTSIIFELRYHQLDGLVFWNGQTVSEEDYLGFGLEDGRLKLVWNLGWYSRDVITTALKYNDDTWHQVVIQRDGQHLTLTVDGETYESRVSGDFYQLDTTGYYNFGLNAEDKTLHTTEEHFDGSFTGCLRELVIAGRAIQFSDVEDGRNVVACDTND